MFFSWYATLSVLIAASVGDRELSNLPPLNFHRLRSELGRLGVDPALLDAIVRLVAANSNGRAVEDEPRPIAPQAMVIDIADIAMHFHRGAIRQREVLGKGGDDISWNMLLAIFADNRRRRNVSVSSACAASGGSQTTAFRYVQWMEDAGFVIKTGDPCDGRRSCLRLSPAIDETVEKLLRRLCIAFPAEMD